MHASAGSKNLYAGFRLDNNLLKNFKKQHADNKVAPNSSLEPDLIKNLVLIDFSLRTNMQDSIYDHAEISFNLCTELLEHLYFS